MTNQQTGNPPVPAEGCFSIGPFGIGGTAPCFIIAELSANHLQKYEIAAQTIEAAARAGANAVKLQTYTADTITIDSDQECFRIAGKTLWDGKTLHQLYREAFTPWEWQPKLKAMAEALGLACFSSPFDFTAVDFLEAMNMPAYKVASLEITDIPLVEYLAAKGKPVIISTGIATLADIEEAVAACRRAGNDRIGLLKCTTAYPAPVDEANLLTIPHLAQTFGAVAGLSDHTLGIAVPIAAAAVGAKIIEKHFIIERSLGGPDAAFSLEPAEFALMVRSVREAEQALGRVSYELSDKTRATRAYARSLFVVQDVRAGQPFTRDNLRSIRPGHGLPPKHLGQVLGQKARRDVKRGTPLSWDLIEWTSAG